MPVCIALGTQCLTVKLNSVPCSSIVKPTKSKRSSSRETSVKKTEEKKESKPKEVERKGKIDALLSLLLCFVWLRNPCEKLTWVFRKYSLFFFFSFEDCSAILNILLPFENLRCKVLLDAHLACHSCGLCVFLVAFERSKKRLGQFQLTVWIIFPRVLQNHTQNALG